jgi:hypothetical protein
MEWTISVKDAGMAENNLFRLLAADPDVVVTDFHRKEYQLEEVFLNIVEGDQHVNRK